MNGGKIVIVLHGLWDKTYLHLWAESSIMTIVLERKRNRRVNIPRLHPFASGFNELQGVFNTLCGESVIPEPFRMTMTVLLPSVRTAPLPSPDLIPESENGNKDDITLSQWSVHTLALRPASALDFLISLPGFPPGGVAFGSSLRFWSEAAKFSLELLARQCFLPAFKKEEQNKHVFFKAAWEAYISQEDTKRIQVLENSMPPVCRALSNSDRHLVPLDLISSFINEIVDAFVRARLTSSPLLPPRRNQAPSLAERWLRALCSDNPKVETIPGALDSFSKELGEWLSQANPVSPDSPFRTCFKLDPPDDDKKKWIVSFHLQANDDRSLLVPAEKVWAARSGITTFLKRRFENPQERLLTDLGKASRVFPAIDKSLEEARPAAVHLDTEQAYDFLRHSTPLLEESGFGVLLPSWWQKPAARLSVRLKVKPKAAGKTGAGLLGMNSLVDYDWQVALGDDILSFEDFTKLADLKVPLVKVRGQWVEFKPGQLEAAAGFFRKRQKNDDMNLSRILRIGLGGDTSEAGIPITGVESEGWVRDIINFSGDGLTMTDVCPPADFKGELRPYQLKGLSWLVFLNRLGLGACLADDMGLGKTIELIALILHERNVNKRKLSSNPTLLICPMSVVGNWQKEIERFAPDLKVLVHHGAERMSGPKFSREARKSDIVISTYALAHRDEHIFSTISWARIALDEAQNIKNPTAKQTQSIKKLCASHRVALTGTPVENRLTELWSIMDFLNPGYLKSAADFHTGFAVPIEKYRNADRTVTLKRLVQPFILRRLKTDPAVISDLPEKMEMKVFCNLTREQATLYQAVVKEMLDKIETSEGIERKGLVLATLTKLKQVCNHPAQFIKDGSTISSRSGKLSRLEEMLEEILAAGEKALIFTQFAEMGLMLQDHLRDTFGCEMFFLHGSTTRKQRDSMVQRFQMDIKEPSVFILSLKAGGVGLNLTAANHVFHFDRWWNPAVENQATDRAFRIGQKKNVQVHKFVCIGTLEERIDQMIEQKKELAESIVGTGEGWLTEMSDEQLEQVFSLRRETIGEE